MPIYEYVCHACGAELEKIQRFSDEPLRDCPECGESALTKKVSAPGFRLKGSGWYVTDFRDGNKTSETASAGGSNQKKTEGSSGQDASNTQQSGGGKSQDGGQSGQGKSTKQTGTGE